MSYGFWKKIAAKKRPLMVLAPMADVTDAAFRRVIARYGKPDVLWTEFVSADGLMSPGRDVLLTDLVFGEEERPIVAQLFSAHPKKMEEAATLVARLGFDGIDINMGCPDASIMKQGAGAALIKNPARAVELIKAAQHGAARGAPKGREVPVSVKTRIGTSKNELATWLPTLLSAQPAVVTIHARTTKELSLVPARWEHVGEAVRIRDAVGSPALIFGNGDIKTIADGRQRAAEVGADGVMIGRGIFGNPWLFNTRRKKSPSVKEKMRVLCEHVQLFDAVVGTRKSFAVMKKHFKAYVQGFDGAKELRVRLMETQNASEVIELLRPYV